MCVKTSASESGVLLESNQIFGPYFKKSAVKMIFQRVRVRVRGGAAERFSIVLRE